MRNYAAECIGTFVLVLGGCGAAVLAGTHIGFAGVAAAFGLSLLVMVYTVGPISGCHLNPAVTLGLVLANKFDPRRAPGYMVAQVLGGIAAAAVLYLVASGKAGFDATASGFATNGYGDRSPEHYGLLACFVSEVVMTGLLMFVILGATDIKAPVGFAGIAIGLTLTVIHLVSIPVTNTSVNPARSIGPALFAGGDAFLQLWLFIVAPLIGSAVAAFVYTALRPIDPEAQLSVRASVQALPTEQEQRVDAAVAMPPVPPKATP